MTGKQKNDNFTLMAFLAVFLGVFLAFGGYTSWTIHLKNMETTWNTALLSNVAGVSLQVLGGITLFLLSKHFGKIAFGRTASFALLLMYFFFMIPVVFSKTITGTFFYGFLMNFAGGGIFVIALCDFAFRVREKRAGIFAAAFASSVFLVRLLSIVKVGERVFLMSSFVLVLFGGAGVAYFLLETKREFFEEIIKRDEETSRIKNGTTEISEAEATSEVEQGLKKKTEFSESEMSVLAKESREEQIRRMRKKADRYEIKVLLTAVFLFFIVRSAESFFAGGSVESSGIRALAAAFFAAGIAIAALIGTKGTRWLPSLALPAIALPLMIYFQEGHKLRIILLFLTDGLAQGLLWMLPFFAVFKKERSAKELGFYLGLGFLIARAAESIGFAAAFYVEKLF